MVKTLLTVETTLLMRPFESLAVASDAILTPRLESEETVWSRLSFTSVVSEVPYWVQKSAMAERTCST